MSLINLSTEGLFTQGSLYDCPHSSQFIPKVNSLFRTWTTEPGAVFSGYRAQALARFGLKESQLMAKEFRESFETLFVLGIGGSALGATAVLSALDWTLSSKDRRRVIIADNLDPIAFEALWSSINPAKTAFAIISKSGGTVETIAQLSLVLDRLTTLGLDPVKSCIAITDPKNGPLRKWALAKSIRSLSVPSDVGGRFSVLTPVGIFPLAFAGIDVESLMAGACDFYNGKTLKFEDSLVLGLRLAELGSAGFVGHVLMPYATILKEFAAWFVQLWGESLGKTRTRRPAFGQIPVSAVGATDQHSLLQLLVEGPNNLITGFLTFDNWPVKAGITTRAVKIPKEFSDLAFAESKSFADILNAEAAATRSVLIDANRPNYSLKLQSPDPACIGAALAFYMDLCVQTAAALELNPFNQPGVELGKTRLPALLNANS